MTITILQAQGSSTTMMLIMAAMFVGFYFLMIRPQVKKQNQEKKFQENLKIGQRVVTTSGIHARIAQIMEDGIVLETMSGKLKFEKTAISREYTQSRFPDSTEAKK
ncbi:MAG: preprotein translocase subunit YajC [Bacteroidetes bacterium]|jgi:preprotein translocase subunit YajC|nr:preprotein translocase subunit YajC [Bacteroidota bacterium]